MVIKFFENNKDLLYFVFRVFAGLLFLQHGIQKVFGIWGFAEPASMFSLMWFAGYIEFLGGIAITLGIFTRLVAFFTAIEMVFAYFMAHVPQGLVPLMNQGELALLYFGSFLVLIGHGSGKWSLERLIAKSEVF